MEYAIHTLEIELARIRQALRIARSTNVSYQDAQEGYPVDYTGLENHIRELERAIGVLNQWMDENQQ